MSLNSQSEGNNCLPADEEVTELLREKLRQHWGYDGFRPLQREAMLRVMNHRDSLIILPTGGGKSLCYQVPALCLDGMAIVVSPLISLMKDQVDSLQAAGVSAACINSMQSAAEKTEVARQVRDGSLKLLYIAPERLVQDKTIEFLQPAEISFVAIDEAHCISQWGHDFRPEYRQLRRLKAAFPGKGIHGYTATATAKVRSDIVEQLHLVKPEVMVGSFDRPNLVYRVERREDPIGQIRTILERHRGESGIIYCISRRNVESISESLNNLGYRTLPYHAGLPDETRRQTQDAFISETVEVIVATVAFGMGIDKSNVRFVVHAEMPRSLENYQQESGRAGRDGLEAECTLLYSAGDTETWEYLMRDTEDPEVLAAGRASLHAMQRYCISMKCRHQQLVQHFGQNLETERCGACDYCLDEMESVPDALVVAQKILSCVIRQGQRFGASYTAQVLRGSRSKRITENGHDRLSTWGLLREESETQVRNWIDQLVSGGFLVPTGEYNCLEVTVTGRHVLKGEFTPELLRVRSDIRPVAAPDQWAGVNRDLFEVLRSLRLQLAGKRKVPPYVVFSDASLRDLARQRPTNEQNLQQIFGFGRRRCQDFGAEVCQTISEWCQASHIPSDVMTESISRSAAADTPERKRSESGKTKPIREAVPAVYSELFEQQMSIEEIALQLGRATSTVAQHLERYLRIRRIADVDQWVPPKIQKKVFRAIETLGSERLKPLFEHLNSEVSYDHLRIVCAAHEIQSAAAEADAED
ncbi:MAG: DNA helicase RecQ [Planctomyces sp.]